MIIYRTRVFRYAERTNAIEYTYRERFLLNTDLMFPDRYILFKGRYHYHLENLYGTPTWIV